MILDVNQRPVNNNSSIAQWVYRAIALPEVRLRIRLRGNDIHILCESQQCPDITLVMPRLLQALKATNGILPDVNPEQPIYQIFLYGRSLEQKLPNWIEPIYLNQLDRHLERWQVNQVNKTIPTETPAASNSNTAKQSSALIVSNESLAKSGAPDAIARYLSEILSSMGVSVRIIIEVLRQKDPQNPKSKIQNRERRLWVICNSDYSPDPAILAEPVAERLRKLKLKGFRDAILRSQVSGENKPDWLLRIDLTPTEEMLKDWARWGDVQAIARLLNQPLADKGIKIRGVLKENTLHLFSSRKLNSSKAVEAPDKKTVIKAIAPLLESLAPQGIHRATIYGVKVDRGATLGDREQPDWLELLTLPASEHPALAETTITLAQQGDEPALLFLVQRFLHPNIDWRLTTGGIRVQISRKHDLLHIMTEAPVCPTQSQVGPPLAKFIRQLRLPKVAGVRVYGRRAGQTSALWSYGNDFIKRKPEKAQPTPNFAPSEVWSGNDIIVPLKETTLREQTEVEVEEVEYIETQTWTDKLYQWLIASQLLISTEEKNQTLHPNYSGSTALYSQQQSFKVACVWGVLGLLLVIQSDWLLGQLLKHFSQSPEVEVKAVNSTVSSAPISVPIPQMSLQKSQGRKALVSNGSGFTKTGDTEVIVRSSEDDSNPFNSPRANAATTAILAAARSSNPSFNNRFLDEKLALYQQRLIQRGGVPPEVLIVGSSRAMRGVDPVALKNALAAQGYADVEVFNFGINGATAQVVDLLLRRILTESQLPKLVIWADGARAFNSGRADHTFQAMETSAGYQQLELKAKNLPAKGAESNSNSAQALGIKAEQRPATTTKTSTVSVVNNWLNTTLEKFSSTYSQRHQLKALISGQLANLTLGTEQNTEITNQKIKADPENSLLPLNDYAISIDGFLAVSSRFNPANYYKKYAKVSGDYDSDYESFQLSGEQDTALQSLLQFVQLNKISLVFVNLPLTKEYLDPIRAKYEQEFQQYMRQVAIQRGLIYREMSQAWPNKNDYFSDPSHLNRYGAYAVSNHLVQDPMIPWPTKF